MAMTAAVKDELSRLAVTKPCCRKAEVASVFRYGGALHLVGGSAGRIAIEAELDTGAAARRLRKDIWEVYSHRADLVIQSPGGLRRSHRYQLRVTAGGEAMARQIGMVDGHGRPAFGLPPYLVNGPLCDCEAVWRGAFLAHGSLTEPGRSSALEITCPNMESAIALAGAARRLGIPGAKHREVRGSDRVVIRDGDAISALLTRLGAHESVLAWEERRMRREVRATANRLANFDDANLRRSARAAVAASARVTRALEILGQDAPWHLTSAGRLRLEHRQASLEELGALSEPPLTKDAIAGRIRRLLAMADRRAFELGIDGTDGPHPAAGQASPAIAATGLEGSIGPQSVPAAQAPHGTAVTVPTQAGGVSADSAAQRSQELPASTDASIVSQVGPGALSSPGSR
jgi:DNA-binding protein WhiA